MSDKSAQTKKKMARNADKIAIAVLAIIFASLLYLWWQEQNSTVGSDAPTGQNANLQDELAESASLDMLQNMSGNPTMASRPDIQRISQLNMFDFSTREQEAQLETQAMQNFTRAKELIAAGQTEEARPLLEEASQVMGYNAEIKSTLDSITTKPEDMSGAGMTDPAMDPSMDPALM